MVDSEDQSTTPVNQGRSISEKIWEELDSIIDKIKTADPRRSDIEMFKLQGEATGIAFCLSKLQFNYYPDQESVLRQANWRWKMKNKLIAWEPTPGYKYNPPPPGTAPKFSAATTQRAPDLSAKAKQLDQKTKAGIIGFLNSGVSAQELAGMFKITENDIQIIQSGLTKS